MSIRIPMCENQIFPYRESIKWNSISAKSLGRKAIQSGIFNSTSTFLFLTSLRHTHSIILNKIPIKLYILHHSKNNNKIYHKNTLKFHLKTKKEKPLKHFWSPSWLPAFTSIILKVICCPQHLHTQAPECKSCRACKDNCQVPRI